MDAYNAHKMCMIQNIGLINKLSADATVCCTKCGARAHDPANLCSPRPLSTYGPHR